MAQKVSGLPNLKKDTAPVDSRLREWDVVIMTEGIVFLFVGLGITLLSGLPPFLIGFFVVIAYSAVLMGIYIVIKFLDVDWDWILPWLFSLHRAANRVLFLLLLLCTVFACLWFAAALSAVRPENPVVLFVDIMTTPTNNVNSPWYGWSHTTTLFFMLVPTFLGFLASVCFAQVGVSATAEIRRQFDRSWSQMLQTIRTYTGTLVIVAWFWSDKQLVIKGAICGQAANTDCSIKRYLQEGSTAAATHSNHINSVFISYAVYITICTMFILDAVCVILLHLWKHRQQIALLFWVCFMFMLTPCALFFLWWALQLWNATDSKWSRVVTLVLLCVYTLFSMVLVALILVRYFIERKARAQQTVQVLLENQAQNNSGLPQSFTLQWPHAAIPQNYYPQNTALFKKKY